MGVEQRAGRGLAACSLLADLPVEEVDAIAQAFEERSADEGELILTEGAPGTGLGFILDGQVAVRVGGMERTRLGRGDMFGEVSAVLREPATADVVALGPVRYLIMDAGRTEAFLTAHPMLLYRLLQAEARRLVSPRRWYAGAAAHPVSPCWSPDSWRRFPAAQQPQWPDRARLESTLDILAQKPPLLFPREAAALTAALGEVAAGRSFLLQAGDCSEAFGEPAESVQDKLMIMLQMAAVLSYGSGVHVVKVGRMAGQFAKPRSAAMEIVDGVQMPTFRGDMVNLPDPRLEARTPDPSRLVAAYHQSAVTLNLLRSLTTGGFAAVTQVQAWNQEFVASSPQGRRYEAIASEIERALRFMRACRVDLSGDPVLQEADFWISHEALILGYEQALTRRDPISGDWYDCSAHMLWVGERTRQLDGAHIEFLSGVGNPVGCKIGPAATPDDVLALCERLNPRRVPGRLTLISRMGAGRVTQNLPPLLSVVREAGHPVVWACDPMHGNTSTGSSGRKTRHFDDILEEIRGFFAACAQESTWPGGIHIELTGDGVTECLGGGDELSEEDLELRYLTTCDPRLNGRQSLDLAFRVAELLRA